MMMGCCEDDACSHMTPRLRHSESAQHFNLASGDECEEEAAAARQLDDERSMRMEMEAKYAKQNDERKTCIEERLELIEARMTNLVLAICRCPFDGGIANLQREDMQKTATELKEEEGMLKTEDLHARKVEEALEAEDMLKSVTSRKDEEMQKNEDERAREVEDALETEDMQKTGDEQKADDRPRTKDVQKTEETLETKDAPKSGAALEAEEVQKKEYVHVQKGWYYDDTKGERHGPFGDATMNSWAQSNQLPLGLMAYYSRESTLGIKLGILSMARGDQWALKGPPRDEEVTAWRDAMMPLAAGSNKDAVQRKLGTIRGLMRSKQEHVRKVMRDGDKEGARELLMGVQVLQQMIKALESAKRFKGGLRISPGGDVKVPIPATEASYWT